MTVDYSVHDPEADLESAEMDQVQYRLEATSSTDKQTWWERILTCGRARAGLSVGVNHNERLASSLHWVRWLGCVWVSVNGMDSRLF